MGSTLSFVLAAEEHHKNNFFYGDINEVIWGSIAFLIIFVLFLWKGVPAVKKAMAKRSDGIATQIESAEAARAGAEAELATLNASLGNADEESRAIVAEATERAAVVRADLIARYEGEVAEVTSRARIEVEAAKQQALADLRDAVVAMTVTATEALLTETLDERTKSTLVDRYIEQVGVSR
jgi:F-type H+-transporting ATPase subunit b